MTEENHPDCFPIHTPNLLHTLHMPRASIYCSLGAVRLHLPIFFIVFPHQQAIKQLQVPTSVQPVRLLSLTAYVEIFFPIRVNVLTRHVCGWPLTPQWPTMSQVYWGPSEGFCTIHNSPGDDQVVDTGHLLKTTDHRKNWRVKEEVSFVRNFITTHSTTRQHHCLGRGGDHRSDADPQAQTQQ